MFNKSLSKYSKSVNYVLFVMFLLFALVQLNDPDPMLWFLIYFIVAMVSLVSNFIVIPKIILFAIGFGLVLYAILHFKFLIDWLNTEDKSEIFGEMVYEKPYLEGSREFIGLFMAILALLFQFKK